MNITGIPNSIIDNSEWMVKNDSSKSSFGIGSATKETDSSSDGKRIGIILVGQTVYMATYADSSTPANPIVKVGDYEISVNDVNPENATEIEMFALLSYMDDTNQTNNKGICSFGKMRAFSDLAEQNGICSGIKDEDAIYNKKQNWVDIIKSVKQIFLGNVETYSQAIDCDNLLYAMSKAEKNENLTVSKCRNN